MPSSAGPLNQTSWAGGKKLPLEGDSLHQIQYTPVGQANLLTNNGHRAAVFDTSKPGHLQHVKNQNRQQPCNQIVPPEATAFEKLTLRTRTRKRRIFVFTASSFSSISECKCTLVLWFVRTYSFHHLCRFNSVPVISIQVTMFLFLDLDTFVLV